jgi:adenosylhomocysteine nucleosidase
MRLELKQIGIIGAMDDEIALLLEGMPEHSVTASAGIEFRVGKFQSKQVVVCKSGVGKVNAAVCTQILIDRFGVDAIIFTGVAGALDPQLNIGDIVVSTECQQHDMDVTALGFPKGTIPFAELSVFQADPELVELAYSAASQFDGQAVRGKVLSGDQFVANRDTVEQLREELQGTCTEMEGAAVAQVCAMNGFPFVIIRSMSDRADGSAHMNFTEFTQLASSNSYRIVEEMLRRL